MNTDIRNIPTTTLEGMMEEAMTEMEKLGFLVPRILIDGNFHHFGERGVNWFVFNIEEAFDAVYLDGHVGSHRTKEKHCIRTRFFPLSSDEEQQ